MKKHGFTLIELLAVIVILAIIALIATPMILGVINTAKEGSAESAATGYVDAVEKAVVIQMLDDEKTGSTTISDGTYKITADGLVNSTVSTETLKVEIKGDAPVATATYAGAYVKIVSGEVTEASLQFDNIIKKAVKYTKAAGSKIQTASLS